MTQQFKENILAIGIIIIISMIYLYPIMFEGLYPTGTDVIGSAGASEMAQNISKKTGERFMWNPALFSGMPTYFAWGAIAWNLDNLVGTVLAPFFNYNALFFLIGGIGVFFLARELKFNTWVAVFTALLFLFVIHNSILFQEGHFKKFRTLMWLPLVYLGFIRLSNRSSLFNMSLFALFLTLMLRGAHYQIIFYTAILLLFVGVYKLYEKIKSKESVVKFVVLSLVAIALSIGAVAQPFFLTKEYTPYSMRGGTSGGYDNENSQKDEKLVNPKDKEGGLAYDYATSWSFPPSEYMTLLVPRFFGGGAALYYDGSNPRYQQFKTRAIPAGYWGDLPFTASTEYIGVAALLFAVIGLILYWKNLFVRTSFFCLLFCILLSFGSHFSLLYDLFYYYVPYFNKFRAPMMILTVINFLFVILAGFGLNGMISDDFDKKEKLKALIYASSFFLGVLLISKLLASGFDFASARELQQYSQQNQLQNLELIKDIRSELFHADVNRSILFLLILSLLSFLFLNDKVKKYYVYAVIIVAVFDLYKINQRYLIHKIGNKYTHLNKPKQIMSQEFQKTKYDEFLLSQKTNDLDLTEHRIYPVFSDFWNTNKYSFYHQSIGGYDPAKMRIYQDLLDHGADRIFLSRNIVNMLNAKYLISEFPIEGQIYNEIKPVFQDGKTKVYENTQISGRAWFVAKAIETSSRDERFNYLKSSNFDVNETALIEKTLPSPINGPKNDTIIIKKLSIHEIEYDVKNDSSSLLVFSEIFYPLGWKAFVDNKETEIYKTNHVLRSIVVPEGEHKITMRFEPENLISNVRISYISTILIFIILILSLIILYSSVFKIKIPEKIKELFV
jgi:hypothetical protein